MRMRATTRTLVTATAVAALALITAACQPLPPVEPGSTLVDCSRAGERVELTASAHLDPSCTYTAGFDITASGVTLDCRGALVKGATTRRQPGHRHHRPRARWPWPTSPCGTAGSRAS